MIDHIKPVKTGLNVIIKLTKPENLFFICLFFLQYEADIVVDKGLANIVTL